MDNKNEKNRSNLVIIVGLCLILVVSLITFFRSGNKKEKEVPTAENNQIEKVSSSNSITPSELKKRLADRETFKIIDIRDKNSFLIEHLANSINIPLEELKNNSLSGDDNTILIVDYDGKNGSKALDILKVKNIKNILILDGGIDAWKNIHGNTVSWGDPTSFIDQSKVNFISADDLKKLIDGKSPINIIDVRDLKSFSEGKIPGAMNYPLEKIENEQSKIKNNKQIIVYGDTELEGFQAGVKLYDLGFFAVKSLGGGFQEWKAKNLPIEK